MDDGSRAILAELKADASESQAAFSLRCPECHQLIEGTHSDLAGHLVMEHDWDDDDFAALAA